MQSLVVCLTAWVSIGAIRKTAEASRVSNIHFEMYKCLYESCKPISQMISHLEGVAHGIVFILEEDDVGGTAYEKYNEEIDGLSDEYNAVAVKQELLLPDKLVDKLRCLIGRINEAQRTAILKVMNPRKNKNNIEAEMYEQYKKELQPKVEEIIGLYEDLINVARYYIGPHELKEIGNFSELRLFPPKDN